jgi:ADP-heptose:LPS heptosyltransferase/predicted SAM-dependent methyltransferase
MTWTLETSKGNESQKCRWEIVQWTRGQGLDIGCGPVKCFPHMIGVDNCHHEMFGQTIKPDIKVHTCLELGIFATESMDFVFSSHTLEHIEPANVVNCLEEWMRVIKFGGYLVMYLPDKKLYPNVGEDGANPDHKWDPEYESVVKYMDQVSCGWEMVCYQLRNQEDEYSSLYVFQKTQEKIRGFSWRRTQPKKTAGVVRYGAFGDLMMASSVFAGLKKQGYHVTLYCSPPGCDVVMHDPNVDHFYYQDKDQVPNHCLGEYWAYHAKKFDKWVNLSESVEGTFLAFPGRTAHEWPPDVRHKMMNRNYLEFQHELAGVPHRPQVRFYPTPSERAWAREQRAGVDFALLWHLSGSSLHKIFPYLDQIVARLLISYPQVHVYLTGGRDHQMLQAGWENEPKVHRTAGIWTIRQSLSFAQVADLIVGPETGLMNSVSCEPMPKVIFLSHSSHENLTRDWENTVALWSKNTTCPGRGRNLAPACHQLHYIPDGWKYCKKGPETSMAQCQEDIGPERAWDAIQTAINSREEKAA